MADCLLNSFRLIIANKRYRIIETEVYYRGPHHVDPFAHRDPIQLQCDRWYVHRTGGSYNGGSFKGLDITFGDGRASGGWLIRGLEQCDGTHIDGPSLVVDHILASAKVNERKVSKDELFAMPEDVASAA